MFLLLVASANVLFAQKQKEKKLADVMASWIDHDRAELYREWGPPANTTSDGAGGEIAIYPERRYSPSATYNMPNGVRYSTGSNDVTINKLFYINKDGIIYYWKLQSVPNAPQRNDVNVTVQNGY